MPSAPSTLALLAGMLIACKVCLASVEASDHIQTKSDRDDRVRFSVVVTGRSSGSVEAMVVSGGGWFTPRQLVHTAVLIEHPKGRLLWDTGIGRHISEQMADFSFLEKQLFKLEALNPAADQLANHGVTPESIHAIIPSHMHWDHASGLKDFSGVPVWVTPAELEGARAGASPAFIQSQFDEGVLWQPLTLDDTPYFGFDKSYDVFGDGRVLLVDLSGHTNGQLGLILKANDQESYFFIGDTTWTIKGIETRRGRPGFVNTLIGVDDDVDKNQTRIDQIYALKRAFQDQERELFVVPAHDELVNLKLPIFPEFLP